MVVSIAARLAAVLLASHIAAGCAGSGMQGRDVFAASFRESSDKQPQELAECIASRLGDDAKIRQGSGEFEVTKMRGLGVLRYRVFAPEGLTSNSAPKGSVVEYASELGRGAELEIVQGCL